jgi:hypothetical protein
MTDKQSFDRQLEREIDILAGPEPRVDVREIVAGATAPRRHLGLGRWFGSVQVVATAAVLVLAFVVTVSFLLVTDRPAVLAPAASPSPAASTPADPGADGVSPVTGTWTHPDPSACAAAEPMASEEWIISLEVCDGLRFDVPDDPRLTGVGQIRHEEWDEGAAPEIWRVHNVGGWWESQRYHDHDRFVFRGRGGYDGLTGVLTLAADGTLSGFIRIGEPREDDE